MYRRGTIEFTRSQSISYRLINFSGFLFDFFSKGSSETISGLKKSSTSGGVGFKECVNSCKSPCMSKYVFLSSHLAWLPPCSVLMYLGTGNLVWSISVVSSTGAWSSCLKFSYSGRSWYPAAFHWAIVCDCITETRINVGKPNEPECANFASILRLLLIGAISTQPCYVSTLCVDIALIISFCKFAQIQRMR